jgi:hypothetical protein
MSLQLSSEASLQRSEFLGRSTGDRFHPDLARLTSLLQIPFDRRSGHAKELDDICPLISLSDRSKHPFSQIVRGGFHDFLLFLLAWFSAFSFPSITGSGFLHDAVGSIFSATAIRLSTGA